jgi:hypothetical protein
VDTGARNYTVACSATSTVERGEAAVYGLPRVHSITGKVTPAVFPVWQGANAELLIALGRGGGGRGGGELSFLRSTECTLWDAFAWQCMQCNADVLVLNDFGEWESSVHVEDGLVNFRLTLSKSELVAVRRRGGDREVHHHCMRDGGAWCGPVQYNALFVCVPHTGCGRCAVPGAATWHALSSVANSSVGWRHRRQRRGPRGQCHAVVRCTRACVILSRPASTSESWQSAVHCTAASRCRQCCVSLSSVCGL